MSTEVDAVSVFHSATAVAPPATGVTRREPLAPPTSITSRSASLPDKRHFPTTVTSRQVSLRDRFPFPSPPEALHDPRSGRRMTSSVHGAAANHVGAAFP